MDARRTGTGAAPVPDGAGTARQDDSAATSPGERPPIPADPSGGVGRRCADHPDDQDCWAKHAHVAYVDQQLAGYTTDGYPVDIDLAAALLALDPTQRQAVLDRKKFGSATTRRAAESGITQFLDLGCGYPLPYRPRRRSRSRPSNIHETFEEVNGRTGARIVHVDSDPMVIAYARAVLDSWPHQVGCLQADISDIDLVLGSPAVTGNITADRPVAARLHAALEWIGDDESVAAVIDRLWQWLPSGSSLSLTHAITDHAPERTAALVQAYQTAGLPWYPRSLADLTGLTAGLPPGDAATDQQWAAGPVGEAARRTTSSVFATTAVKP
ncbi:SAM-dependent methyltransferase [Streptacidiphilus sp. EB103A]|uniref:SAM-dependent methyltransferase n=1 Tax=Streptacidiphilus sp. EB103A TaxID=3156275 RepID=UPI00351804FA